jgi:hypothetical protein
MSNHAAIRRLLLANKDGLTLMQISSALGKDKYTLRQSINSMPDVYIDRYVDTSENPKTGELRGGTPWSPVYCAVTVPPDCPMPRRKS